MSTNATSTVVQYLNGTAPIPQAFLGVVVVAIVYTVMISAEFFYKSLTQVARTRTALLPYTYTSDKTQEIRQDPNDPASNTVALSDNELTGIEFSYSCFLNLNESTFQSDQTQEGLMHVFHKGYSLPFPLMGPGVFVESMTNCIRVYMNSTNTWNNYVSIENIPLKKWFHLVVVCRKGALEVYLNGNLSKKLNFEGATPYQNFGNIYAFSQRRAIVSHSIVPSTDDTGLALLGPANGMLSRLEYFSYAMSFTEINALLNQGPSTHIVSATQNKPPYLADTYWTTNYTR